MKTKAGEFLLKTQLITLNASEREAFQAAMMIISEQSRNLGLLDPMDAEPAQVFFASEETR